MKVSYTWLKEHIELEEEAEKVAEWLTDTGLEVEHCVKKEQIEGGLEGLVVGHVLECWQHPNADRLKLTRVDVGQDEPLQIVCGAPNVGAGQKVAVALVNSVLYPVSGDSFKIKKGKIRGEVSMGMLCAEDEIGLGESHDGIMILPEDAAVGTPLAKVVDVQTDFQIEIGLTPNRGDAISHMGVARDIKALTGRKMKKKLSDFPVGDSCPVAVQLESSDDCPRYSGVMLDHVNVKPSPQWLQDALKRIDVRPINNVVDVTNYVLHDIGQPIHAFDVSKISEDGVLVRRAKKGEKMTTLDEAEREFSGEELLITSGGVPLALAGVFGGLNSGVTEETTKVFIESAYFNPAVVRKSAKLHGLNTDASFRYERGCDPDITLKALNEVVRLLEDVAGAQVVGSASDVYPNPIANKHVPLSLTWLNGFCGTNASADEVEGILNRLDIGTLKTGEGEWNLSVPPYRSDVTRPVDIAEEFLRIYGYNEVEIPTKLSYGAVFGSTENWNIKQKVRKYLAAQGWQEVMNNSQVPGTEEEGEVVLKNPLSAEYAAMRMSMRQGVLQNIAYNLNRKNTNLMFFEFGKVYTQSAEGYSEEEELILAATGHVQESSWHGPAIAFDAFHLKDALEGISRVLHVPMEVMQIEEIRKATAAEKKPHGIKPDVFLVEVSWKKIQKKAKKGKVNYKEVSPYPEVERDLSVVVDQNISYSAIEAINLKYGGKQLKGVHVFDIYEGERIDEGKKAVAMRYTFGDSEGTMKDKAVDKTMDRLMQKFESELHAVIRR